MLMSAFCLMIVLVSYRKSNLQVTANRRTYIHQLENDWYIIYPGAAVRPVNLQNQQNPGADQWEKQNTASQLTVSPLLTGKPENIRENGKSIASFLRGTPSGTYKMNVYRQPKIHQSTTLFAPFQNQPDLVLWMMRCYSDLVENLRLMDANYRHPLGLTKRDDHLDDPHLSVYEAETQSGTLRRFLRKLQRMAKHIQLPSCNKRMAAKQEFVSQGQHQGSGEFITKGIFQELDYNRK
ncbi:hypothetical protein EG68_11061 [Paragonimus skrjabini miyazakii]|uniref:Uncharacterized protein n=1 Tax=Paragonimus skrjabini miyazakii TaxID=59628 RepID=A0A8S9YR26_9TREM|nr:hypothetical protein EG68_11061 [Paragonimus skrjabini miyazakii]